MNITLNIFLNDFKIPAQSALTNRLFVNGWQLGKIYREILNDSNCEVEEVKAIGIAIDEDLEKPIASCFCGTICEEENLFQIFVRKSYRRKGIGSVLYNAVGSELEMNRPMQMWYDHSDAAGCFYYKNKNFWQEEIEIEEPSINIEIKKERIVS